MITLIGLCLAMWPCLNYLPDVVFNDSSSNGLADVKMFQKNPIYLVKSCSEMPAWHLILSPRIGLAHHPLQRVSI